MSGIKPSPAQLAHRQRFRQAALFGKMVMADPESKTLYTDAAKAKGQPVFSLIVADFFNAPTVDEVDVSGYGGAAGDEIVIRAGDDFEVIGVEVAISNANGAVIERGPATAANGRWFYTTTAAVPPGTAVRILVTATDRPGGVGEVSREVVVEG